MSRQGVVAVVLTLALAVSGCAVLTVDVDVYKGALANHESVLTEQAAAMAMGAKPLLAELRYRLERQGCFMYLERRWERERPGEPVPKLGLEVEIVRQSCPALGPSRDKASAVPDGGFRSRDARRVNAVLSLYERRARADAERVLDTLGASLETLTERIERGLPIVAPYLHLSGDAARHLARVARETAPAAAAPAPASGARAPFEAEVQAVRDAWGAALDAWGEAIRLLASSVHRAQLRRIHPDAIDAAAWVAADLSSPEGLRKLLGDPATPAQIRTGAIADVAALVPVLTGGAQLTPDGKHAAGAVLAQRLTKDSTGVALAAALAAAQAYAMSRTQRNAFAVIYPTEEVLKDGKGNALGVKATSDYLERTTRVVGSGFDRGRSAEGLQELIEDYLKANGGDARSGATLGLRRQLLDSLVNFAEKVSIIADFDTLLRGPEDTSENSRRSEARKYVRVLQAVGNSIISQVDALRQSGAHREGLQGARDIELAGLRSAEARAAAVLRDISAELNATPTGFPGRAAILERVTAAQTDLGNVLAQIGSTRAAEGPLLVTERATAAPWIAADTVVARPETQAAVEQFGGANPAVTVPTVAQELIRLFQTWIARTRLSDGPDAPELERLRSAVQVLRDPMFNTDPAPAGTARVKYQKIVEMVTGQRATTLATAAKRAADVATLDRWHGAVTRLVAGGAVRVAVPARIENATLAHPESAKDVLDTMLATLRYEHVAAVADGRESEAAKNRAAAVELLHAYRSGMVHIRPAFVFLRNSYPASVLQADPTAGVWRNMLTDHALRQVPFYGRVQTEKEEAQINRTIDKQFWQSVNQVRLAGVGRTNYVIAKDDIGNWYVKSYTSNPQDIIQSAKNLALFSAGPALGANLLARGGRAQSVPLPEGASVAAPPTGGAPAGAPAAPVSADAPRSTLSRQLDRVTDRYVKGTRESREQLGQDLAGLSDKLRSAVSEAGVAEADVTKLADAGVFAVPNDPPRAALAQERDAGGQAKGLMNAEMAVALRFAKRLRQSSVAKVTAIKPAADGAAPTAQELTFGAHDRAKAAITATIRDLLERHLRERQGATREYESSVLFIGETAGF